MADGGFNQLSKVELSISCTKLLDLDTFSKSDPFAVLYKAMSKGKKQTWFKLGRTEVIYDNLDPKVRKYLHAIWKALHVAYQTLEGVVHLNHKLYLTTITEQPT